MGGGGEWGGEVRVVVRDRRSACQVSLFVAWPQCQSLFLAACNLPSTEQLSDKNSTKRRKKEEEEEEEEEESFSVSFFIVLPFICCLSVVLWLDKEDFPKNVHLCVCFKINKRSFEPCCVWIFRLRSLLRSRNPANRLIPTVKPSAGKPDMNNSARDPSTPYTLRRRQSFCYMSKTLRCTRPWTGHRPH